MKKILTPLFIIVFLSLTTNVMAKTYKVVTNPTYPPFEFIDNHGEIIGFDVDLIKAIAENQGFSVDIVYSSWEDVFQKVSRGEGDIMMGGIAATDIDGDDLMPTDHYLVSLNCLAYVDNNVLSDWYVRSVSVIDDEALQEILKEKFNVKNQQPVDTTFLGLKAVATRRADVLAGDCTVLSYYANSLTFKRHGINFGVKVLYTDEIPGEEVNLIFTVRQSDSRLRDKINQGIANLKANGKLEELLKKWHINSNLASP